MTNYIGVRCPGCSKKFTSADDVVVCPVCGAPQHRECYLQKGECVFSAGHLSGHEWKPPAPEGGADELPPVKLCARCGSSNPDESLVCQTCGRPFPGSAQDTSQENPFFSILREHGYRPQDTQAMQYGGVSPDETMEGEKVRDIARFVGENSAYYLSRFKMISEGARKVTVNFSAMFFGYFYFFYRKNYLVGTLLLLLSLIAFVPRIYYTIEYLPEYLYTLGMGPAVEIDLVKIRQYAQLTTVAGGIKMAIQVAVSFFANRLYLSTAVSSVRRIRIEHEQKGDQSRYLDALSLAGGRSKTTVLVVLMTVVFLYLLVANLLAQNAMGG